LGQGGLSLPDEAYYREEQYEEIRKSFKVHVAKMFALAKIENGADLAEKMVQMAGLTLGKDIEIVFTGLRPGEKLYEELLSEQEGTILTHHPKIKKAAVRVHDYLEASQQVDMLCQLVQTGCTDQEIVETMKTIVPEFISQNSIYETNNNSKPQSPPPN
jgi:FlaA1/EpsC-like NDP-sugar epimerase